MTKDPPRGMGRVLRVQASVWICVLIFINRADAKACWDAIRRHAAVSRLNPKFLLAG